MGPTTTLLIVLLLGAIALSALLISMAALSQTRSIWRKIAAHEDADTNAHGEIYGQLNKCNRACQNVLRDICGGISRIEGWIEAQDPDFARRRAAALRAALQSHPPIPEYPRFDEPQAAKPADGAANYV